MDANGGRLLTRSLESASHAVRSRTRRETVRKEFLVITGVEEKDIWVSRHLIRRIKKTSWGGCPLLYGQSLSQLSATLGSKGKSGGERSTSIV